MPSPSRPAPAAPRAADPALAALPRRPLPPFPGWRAALGPGIVWMALAQGSGELIWWPYLVAKYGLTFVALLAPACLLQYPLSVEIGRYTLLTGETIFRGFIRLHRGFGVFLWVLMTLSFLWFGAFAAAGGTAIAALTGLPAGWGARAQALFWGYASIAVFVVALALSRVVYRVVEGLMKAVAVVTLAGLVWACLEPPVLAAAPGFLRGLLGLHLLRGDPGATPRPWDPADATKLLTAIAFAGLGGFWTLFYSYWLRDKGSGMAAYAGRITGLRAAEAEAVPTDGWLPEDTGEMRERWTRWRRFLAADALVGVGGNLVTTLLACLLAWALLFPQGLLPQEYELAVVQSRFFEVSWGPVGRVVFLAVAAAFLTDTWLTTADGVSRLQADIVRTLFPGARRIGARRWYYLFLALLTAVTCGTMLLDAPGPLILLSAVIGFAGTVIFPVALYLLNHRRLAAAGPAWARPRRGDAWRLGASFAAYLALALAYLWETLGG